MELGPPDTLLRGVLNDHEHEASSTIVAAKQITESILGFGGRASTLAGKWMWITYVDSQERVVRSRRGSAPHGCGRGTGPSSARPPLSPFVAGRRPGRDIVPSLTCLEETAEIRMS